MKKICLLMWILLFSFAGVMPQSTLTINPATTYQTIAGFGGSKALTSGYDNFMKYIVDMMGITIFRQYMDGDASGKTITPADINSGTFDFTDNVKYVNFFNALKLKGVDTIIASCWSPPASLKKNGCISQTVNSVCGAVCPTYNCADTNNYLLSNYYNEYGKYLAAWIKDFESKTTQKIYAFSIQNEPLFNEPYASAKLYAPKYGPCLKAVRLQLDSAGLTHVKMHGPEHTASYFRNSGGEGGTVGSANSKYIQNLLWNSTYSQYLDIYSTHGYHDGIAPDLGSAPQWTLLDTAVRSKGKDLWMTETSFAYAGSEDWSDLYFPMAKQIYLALKYGKVNSWIYWNLGEMYASGSPSRRLYVAMHYMRFIRPGYVQVECTESDPDVASVAFKNGNDFTIVAINLSTTKSKTIQCSSFINMPSFFHMYRSSRKENGAYIGKITSNSFDLLPESISTLYFKASEPDLTYGPKAPTNLDTTNIADNSISVKWTGASGWTLAGSPVAVSGYVVYIDGIKQNVSGPITATNYKFTGLKPGTTYTIEIVTRDAMYNESASASITVTTTCSEGNCLAVEETSCALSLYPNPAGSNVKIELPGNEDIMEITLIDLTGKTVLKKQVSPGNENISVDGLSKGVYFVVARGVQQTYKAKLLVE